MNIPSSTVLVISLLIAWAPEQKKVSTDPHLPEVGRIAPPLGALSWMQMGGKAKSETDLARLRGKVVIVADYGYYCDSCLRVGVPALKALRDSNASEGLVILHLTAGIGDDTPEKMRAEGEKLGLVGPLAMTDVTGQGSAYLDMSRNGNLTYATVIGRHGGVVWRGDPSMKRAEYVAAVGSALNAPPCAALPAPESLGPEIGPALLDYVQGDFGKAETAAQALEKKAGARSGADGEKMRADTAALIDLVAQTRKLLVDELEASAAAKDAHRFAKAALDVRRAFPKGAEVQRAAALETELGASNDVGPELQKWTEWLTLAGSRPANFPAEKDASTSKFAKELDKYVKRPEMPEIERVKAWLERFATATPHK